MSETLGCCWWKLDWCVSEQLPITSRDLIATLDEPVEVSHLREAESGLNVGEPVVVPERADLVVPAAQFRFPDDPVGPEGTQTVSELLVVDRDIKSTGQDICLDLFDLGLCVSRNLVFKLIIGRKAGTAFALHGPFLVIFCFELTCFYQ